MKDMRDPNFSALDIAIENFKRALTAHEIDRSNEWEQLRLSTHRPVYVDGCVLSSNRK